MNTAVLAVNKVVFKAERSISWHGYSDSAPYVASVEAVDSNVSLVLDDSEYCFTAQQCAEVTKNLVMMLLKCKRLPNTPCVIKRAPTCAAAAR